MNLSGPGVGGIANTCNIAFRDKTRKETSFPLQKIK
jgi:hypothetical protein